MTSIRVCCEFLFLTPPRPHTVCYDKKTLPAHLKDTHSVDHKFDVIEVTPFAPFIALLCVALIARFACPARCRISLEASPCTTSTAAWAA